MSYDTNELFEQNSIASTPGDFTTSVNPRCDEFFRRTLVDYMDIQCWIIFRIF